MDVYIYADETGNLDYEGQGKKGASTYFGFGTATYFGDHASEVFGGLKLRAELDADGVKLPSGFHAVNDKLSTKNQVFPLIKDQAPRFDATFLCKSNAYEYVRERGQNYLYKLAWHLHLKHVVGEVSNLSDTVYVIAGTFGTANRRTLAEAALADVCAQQNRDIKLCVWEAATSWGLQVADYGLWATQRTLEGRKCSWYEPCIEPTLRSNFLPWGSANNS